MVFRKSNSKSIFAVIALVGSSLSFSAVAEEQIQLRFGVYSSNKPTAMVRTFKPILNSLEQRMSEKLQKTVDIRMQIAKSYEEGVSDLTGGRVDFSRFGPASYIEAKNTNPDLEIIAIESVNAKKVIYGIVAINEASDIKSISELKQKSFAFGNETSTIGRYLSQLYLERNGVRAKDLKDYEYLGRHDKVGTAVGAGDFDAGALNESTFKKLIAKGEPIKELARFPNVSKPWIARAGLDDTVLAALRESLLELSDPKTLKSLKVDGFLPGTDDDYQTIRDSIELNDVFFSEKIQVSESDSTISPADGAIQINIRFTNKNGGGIGKIGTASDPLIVDVVIDGDNNAQSVVVTQSDD